MKVQVNVAGSSSDKLSDFGDVNSSAGPNKNKIVCRIFLKLFSFKHVSQTDNIVSVYEALKEMEFLSDVCVLKMLFKNVAQKKNLRVNMFVSVLVKFFAAYLDI